MSDPHPMISMLKDVSIRETGAHILYMFNEMEHYLANAVHYIADGLIHDEVVLYVDTQETIEEVREGLIAAGLNERHLRNLIISNNKHAYLVDDEFDLDQTAQLIERLQPFLDQRYEIRTWGHVPTPIQHYVLEKVQIFETNSDDFIARTGLLSVCAYNGLTTPAYIQNELLKTHEYFMTDREYNSSPFYRRGCMTVPPSSEELSRLRKLELKNRELQDRNDLLAQENRTMARNETLLRTIIDHMPIPIIIRRNTELLFLNRNAQETFSIENNDLTEKDHLARFFGQYDSDPPEHRDKDVQHHQLLYRNGKKASYLVQSIEMIYEGAPSVLHSFIDVTHEKDQELKIIRSEKLNVAGELAAGIAHELRNPLTAIKGFFHMLRNEKLAKEKYYSIIDDELSRIEQISSELLALAKPHSDKRSRHDIVKLIQDVKLLLTSHANLVNIEVDVQSRYEELMIECEETKVKQVFINLIKNAMDAMDSGGRVVINIVRLKDSVQISIHDHGSGMSQEMMDKLGEPFYTTKEKGTGIGLMVCYQIIERHQGSIQVKSEVGVGSTFTITLPSS